MTQIAVVTFDGERCRLPLALAAGDVDNAPILTKRRGSPTCRAPSAGTTGPTWSPAGVLLSATPPCRWSD